MEKEFEDNPMPLIAHLIELRQRLLFSVLAFMTAFCLCYFVAVDIYNILMLPLANIMHEVGGTQRMIYTSMTEGFFTNIRLGAFGALMLTFPVFVTQIWLFIVPGLYKKEKKVCLPFLIASPVLFMLGAALVYFIIIPLAWRFLLGFQTMAGETVLPIQLEARVGDYLSLVMTLVFAFGFCFQFPVLLTLLSYVGFITSEILVKMRKYAVVAVFVVASIATPPDVISQIGLAVPLLILYELSIYASRMVEKRKEDEAVG